VHIRRALLLFAIVLGLAAIVASVSRPDEDRNERSEPPTSPPLSQSETDATISPGRAAPSPSPAEVTLEAPGNQTRRVSVGQPVTLMVEVDEPGQVGIPDLGLIGTADPLTPARFEILASEPARYAISFTPAAGDEPADAGTLVVEPTGE
jgi:hypothetical protein